MEKTYTVREIARLLDIAERTVRKRIEDGKLQSCHSKYNPQAPHLVPESFLYEYIANNPDLDEVKKFKTEKARMLINEMRDPYKGKNER